MIDERLISDLKKLREEASQQLAVPSFNERVRTYQNVGAFILRQGRLDVIIEALERDNERS